MLFDYALSPHVKLDLPSFDFLKLLASELLESFGVLVVYVYLKYFTVSDTRSDLFDCFSSLLGEVSHQALQDGSGDVLLEPCLIHPRVVDPVVASLPRPLYSLEDPGLPHGFEDVDDAGAAYGVGLELGVDSVPYGFGAEASVVSPDGSEGELLVVLEDGS